MQGFEVEKHIKTCANPRGICAISSNNDGSVLTTLGEVEGTIIIQNSFLKNYQKVKAFDTPIQQLAISLDVISI